MYVWMYVCLYAWMDVYVCLSLSLSVCVSVFPLLCTSGFDREAGAEPVTSRCLKILGTAWNSNYQ